MKIICIDNGFRENQLTLDKWYDVINNYNNEAYTVIDDTGTKYQFAYWRFMKADDLRDGKLIQLGI